MTQSFHQQSEYLELILNKTRFAGLPADLQAILRYAAMAEATDYTMVSIDRNSTSLDQLKQGGTHVIPTPKQVLIDQLDAWDAIMEAKIATNCAGETNCLYARIVESQRAWVERIGRWRRDILADPNLAFEHSFGE